MRDDTYPACVCEHDEHHHDVNDDACLIDGCACRKYRHVRDASSEHEPPTLNLDQTDPHQSWYWIGCPCGFETGRKAALPSGPDYARGAAMQEYAVHAYNAVKAKNDALRAALRDSICLVCHGEGYVGALFSDEPDDEYGECSECETCAGSGRREQDIDELRRLIGDE